MSGLEIAGLALAVFPLIVKGLRHFPAGAENIKPWRDYQKELRKYSRTLATQQTIFLNTISKLFDGIIESNDALEVLLENPQRALSHGQQYEDALERRLGRSYDNFIFIVEEMLETLRKVREELGIDETGKVSWDDFSSLKRHGMKFKLMTHKNIYTESLTQIKESNQQLRQFANDSYVLESCRKKRRAKYDKVDFQAIRNHARSLHNVIVSGRSWKCQCWKHHMASLRLEARSWREDSKRTSSATSSSLKFQVLLSKKQVEGDEITTWKWQQVEVESRETLSSATAAATRVEYPAIKFTTLSITQPSKGKSKAVSFAEPSAISSVQSDHASMAPTSLDPNIRLIENICTALHSISNVDQCVGYLEDEGRGKYRHDIYLKHEQLRQQIEAESLEQLLEAPHQQRLRMGLSRRNRLHIAVTLASSVLQLDGTCWLSKRWRSKDILFLPLEGQDTMARRIDYLNPYIAWQRVSRDGVVETRSEPEAPFAVRHIRHYYLFALGCTLIELSLNRRLCDMRTPDDIQSMEAQTDFNTAMRLVDAVYEESGTKWGDVIYKCLTCPFNLRDPRNLTIDNEEFQEAVYNDVLTPLRQDFENFDGIDRIR